MTLVGARGVVPVNVLGRGADRWGLLALVLVLLVWKRVWVWLLLLVLVLVFRLRLKERREVGTFRCISAFFRHVFFFSLLPFPASHTLSFIHTHTQSLSLPLALSCCCRRTRKRCRNWNRKLETGDWRPLRTNNVTGVIGTVLADGTVQRRPDQEPNGSYTFFVGPLGFGAPCRAWAVQAIIRVISVMSECPPMQLPGAGRCSQVRNLALATAARRRASTHKARAGAGAPCALRLWGSGDGGAR